MGLYVSGQLCVLEKCQPCHLLGVDVKQILMLLLHQGAVQESCFSLKLAVKKLIGSTSSSSAWDHDREPSANALWGFPGASWKYHRIPGLAPYLTWTMCLGKVPGPDNHQSLISVFRDGSDTALPQLVLLYPLQVCSGFITL